MASDHEHLVSSLEKDLFEGADGFSGKERIPAVDRHGNRQGGIGPGVGLSLLQARHPGGMRAEWFDRPGVCPGPVMTPL